MRVQTRLFRTSSCRLSAISLYPPSLKYLRKSRKHFTFNHGVEGSSPSALTKQIKYLQLRNLF